MIDNKVRQWPVLGAKEPTLTRSPRPENSDLNAQLQDQTFSEFTGRGERGNGLVEQGNGLVEQGNGLVKRDKVLANPIGDCYSPSLLNPTHQLQTSQTTPALQARNS